MAQGVDYIGRYVDFEEAGKSTAHMLNSLKQVQDALNKVAAIKISIGSADSTKDFVKAAREAKDASENLTKSSQKLIDIDIKAARVATEKAKAAKILASSMIEQEKELERLIKLEEKQKAIAAKNAAPISTTNISQIKEEAEALKKTGDVINDLDRAQLEAQQSAIAWANAQRAAAGPMKETKKSASELRKEKESLAKIEARDKLLASQAAAALKNRVREEVAAKGSLEQRRAALIRLQVAYDNLNEAERKSASGLRLEGIVSRLTNQVKGLEAATGRAQRNVGNYGSALNKVWGGLRRITYLIPGLGMAGLFSLAFDGISKFIKGLDLFKSKVPDFERSQSAIKESLKGAQSEFVKAYTNVETLRQSVQLAKEGFLDKDKVVKDFNESMGKAVGQASSLEEVEQKLIDNAENYIKVTYLKAAAQIALGKAADAAFEAEEARRKRSEEFLTQGQKATGFLSGQSSAPGWDPSALLGQNDKIQKDYLKASGDQERKNFVDAKEERVSTMKDIAGQFLKEVKVIAKDFKGDPFGDGDKESASIRPITKKFFDKELKDQIAQNKKLSDLNSLELKTRVNARKAAAEQELKVIEGIRNAELKNEQDKLNEAKKTATGNALINAENAYAQKVAEINRDASYERKKVEENTWVDLLNIRQSYIAKYRSQDEDLHKMTLEGIREMSEDKIKAAQAQEAKEVAGVIGRKDASVKALNDRYQAQIAAAKGNQDKIKEADDQFAKDRADIEFRYAAAVLRIEITTAEVIIAIRKKLGQDTSAAERTLHEARMQLSDLETKHVLDSNKQQVDSDNEKTDKVIKNLQKIREITQSVFDVIGGAINASVVADKNRIEEQIKNLEAKEKKEIEVAEQTIANEQEKAAAITTIRARADVQREALERKQRQAEERQARFEKSASIASIILNTAVAVAAALKKGPLAAIAAGAIGAAQLAVAIATPIPKYRYGTKDHPGGLATVGDGGKKEFVILPSGHGFVTPDKPTTLNLPERTQVLPDAEAYLKTAFRMSLNRPVMPYRDAPAGMDNTEMTRQISRKLDRLNSTIKNKRETHITGSHGSIVAVQRWANSQISYVEDVVKL